MVEEHSGAEHFAQALTRFERWEHREGERIAQAGRSRLLEHGRMTPRAFVLLHGLTTTPAQLVDFAEALYRRGSNVFVPRLPRHGHANRMTSILAGLTEAELMEAGAEIIAVAAGLGRRVTVLGFSAGGLVAAWIAQHLAVDRVVTIAPFLGVGWVPTRLGRTFTNLILRAPNLFLWWHPIERERHAPVHGYPRYATHAVARTWRLGLHLLGEARRFVPATRNIAIVTNASETTVNNRAVARLADAWSSHAGVRVRVHVLSGLRRSHDIMEPNRRRALAGAVYPVLLDIVTEES